MKMGAQNVTIANEQSTINAFCNFFYLKAKIRLKVEKLRQSFFLQMSQDQQLKGDSQSY
jgi:hypothetical protein